MSHSFFYIFSVCRYFYIALCTFSAKAIIHSWTWEALTLDTTRGCRRRRDENERKMSKKWVVRCNKQYETCYRLTHFFPPPSSLSIQRTSDLRVLPYSLHLVQIQEKNFFEVWGKRPVFPWHSCNYFYPFISGGWFWFLVTSFWLPFCLLPKVFYFLSLTSHPSNEISPKYIVSNLKGVLIPDILLIRLWKSGGVICPT